MESRVGRIEGRTTTTCLDAAAVALVAAKVPIIRLTLFGAVVKVQTSLTLSEGPRVSRFAALNKKTASDTITLLETSYLDILACIEVQPGRSPQKWLLGLNLNV